MASTISNRTAPQANVANSAPLPSEKEAQSDHVAEEGAREDMAPTTPRHVAAPDVFDGPRRPTERGPEPGTVLDQGLPVTEGSWRLDWSEKHAAATKALPKLSDDIDTGLVRIDANGMEFRARVYGMHNDGPGIVMIHGFPASSVMWEEAAKEAASRGYRVVAYDQRGTSPGARPLGKDAYEIDDYLGDLEAIAARVGFDDFHAVGHDVGAVVAWGAAMAFPEKIRSLSTMSIPNPQVLNIRPYVKAFSIPFVPEAILQFNRSALFRKLLPQGRSPAENDEYRRIFTEPGALTSTLNFYRGVNRSVDYMKEKLDRKISMPTHFMYGEGEGWVDDAALEDQRGWMGEESSLNVTRVEDAGETGHFLVENQPGRVIRQLLGHIDTHR